MAKKASVPHHEYINRKKIAFQVCIAPWNLLKSIQILHYSKAGRVSHTANLMKFALAICEIAMGHSKFQFNFFS